MALDVLTPKGQESIGWEDAAVELWSARFPRFAYTHTPKGKPAKADAMLVCGQQLHAVVEMKCRPNLTHKTLMGPFKGRWLVTFQKIIDCVRAAELLALPFVGMLYLVDEDILLWKKLWTPEDGYTTEFGVLKTDTQATINGGTATRDNAYIDMRDAHIIRRSRVAETP